MGKVIILFILLFSLGCDNQEEKISAINKAKKETPAVIISKKATQFAGKIFSTLNLKPKIKDNMIVLKGKKISFNAVIENTGERRGKTFIAAKFQVCINNKVITSLTTGAVGIGNNSNDSLNTLFYEWAMQYGAPILFAILNRELKMDTLQSKVIPTDLSSLHNYLKIDNYLIFYGPMGLRGQAKEPGKLSSTTFTKNILQIIVSAFRKQKFSENYGAATLMLIVSGNKVSKGECRINSLISENLLLSLNKIKWPEASPFYMYKHYFVILKTRK